MGTNCSRKSAIRTENSLRALPSLISITSLESNSRLSTPIPTKQDEIEAILSVQPVSSSPPTRTPSPADQSMTKIENPIVVWLTIDSNRNQLELDRIQRRLRSFQCFTDVDEFYSFIFQLNGEQVFLIVSDELGQKIISLIHSRSELVAFYILDREETCRDKWKNSYRKLRGIFSDFDTMFEEICSKILLKTIDQMPIDCVSTTSIGYRDAFQELIQNETNYRQESRKSFIELARQHHQDELTTIEEFERTYTRETSISWFTRKSFVYSMINDAYRSKDVKELLSSSFIIQDIRREIEEHFQIENSPIESMNVFCGQGMTENEFERLKNNDLSSNYLAFPNFLWSTIDRFSALSKAHLARNHVKYCGTLFSIEIQSTVPHLSLENYSESSNEFLFSIDGLFRVKNCRQIEDYVWQVDLIYVSTKTHPDFIDEYRLFTENCREKTNWEKLSLYLIETKQFHRLEIIHNALIELNFLHDSKQLATLHEQLAFIYDETKNFDRSLIHYRKSLKFYLRIFSSNDKYLLPVYQQIGILFYHKKQYKQAVQYFKCALTIAIHACQLDYIEIADFYHLIGKSFENQGDSMGAIVNYQLSLENKLRQEPIDYLSVAESYRLIGDIFSQIFDSSTALSYYQKTLEIQKRFLSPNHSILALTHYKLARVHNDLHQYKEAVEFICRALNIARHSFGSENKQVELYRNYLEELRRKTNINVIPNGAVYG